MMPHFILLLLIVLSAVYLIWGIKALPRERWQILAAVPLRKRASGKWDGLNLTWYGLLTANAYAVAVAVLLVLMGAVQVSLTGTLCLATALLTCCVPASRLVARLVEKKSHTFTVGGAVFVGVLLAPWIVLGINRGLGSSLGFRISPAAALAALAIAYAFGEGLGRLACISFGCCYGKPLDELPPLFRRIFAGLTLSFHGSTKKIAYAGGLEGIKVFPVQALTAVVYVSCGIVAAVLFLSSKFVGAFIVTMVITQGWRILSETVRADYRGNGNVSAYQVMGLIAIVYGGVAMVLVPSPAVSRPDIVTGVACLWTPSALVFLQTLWFCIFLYTGRSSVTGASLSFHVNHDRI